MFAAIAQIGADASDDDENKLQKSLMVLCSFPFIIAAIVWALIYIALGEAEASIIPLAYAVYSSSSLIYFGVTKQFRIFRIGQLLGILLLPAGLTWVLGGFVNSSAVILWSFIAPLGAMVFGKPRDAPGWFMGFLALVILSGIIEPLLPFTNHFTSAQIIFFFVLNISVVGALIFWMVFYFVSQKNIFQERSELLLLNILPKEIVAVLKKGPRTIADYFDGASILFADVVNFTQLVTSMSPNELVDLLNEVFSKFDLLVDKYGLEKIKTIGDCYMVASGVPRPNPAHATALTSMAMEMRDYILEHEFLGHKLHFRIGINSGPVVAGVIGQKKFIYDLWGDAVNIASRMETHGQEGQIQITHATYHLIKDEFDCKSQGTVYVKGKGEMEAWLVKGRRA